MTNPIINPQPNYSGVTIQITNPAVNVGNTSIPPEIQAKYGCYPPCSCCQTQNAENISYNGNEATTSSVAEAQQSAQVIVPAQSYPAQYYLNNYNYQTNGSDHSDSQNNSITRTSSEVTRDSGVSRSNLSSVDDNVRKDFSSTNSKFYIDKNGNVVEDNSGDDASGLVNRYAYAEAKKNYNDQDFSKSNNIISDLDAREIALQEAKKNTKEKRVVALTDEYIKSLENYLNNPNNEIRLMASKEILTRLDEDKDRYNDAALNALLNKMLQDPSKMVRIAALSAFASQLASGNDYTVQLLQNIQNNPSADKEDVLQAADILLKMSADTEIKRVPIPPKKEDKSKLKG